MQNQKQAKSIKAKREGEEIRKEKQTTKLALQRSITESWNVNGMIEKGTKATKNKI